MSKKAAPTDEELLAQFDNLDDDSPAPSKPTPSSTTRTSSRPPASKKSAPTASNNDADLFADIDASLAQERSKSRSQTPAQPHRSTASGPQASPQKQPETRTSEDRATPVSAQQQRRSAESTRSFHQAYTPQDSEGASPGTEKGGLEQAQPVAQSTPAPAASGGGWWGSVFSTVSAAAKQAEALAKEIQKNEEAQKWARQVQGNVGALRGIGDELRSRALPTFSSLLHTLAPPISAHERLRIHATHDFRAYPSLDPLIYSTFSRVMAQVEGGELLVVQKGQESAPSRGVEGYTGGITERVGGWNDGPWWKEGGARRDLGAVAGLVEGSKLARVASESYAAEFFAPRGGVEEAAKKAAEGLSESNPTRSSDIFLALQAISVKDDGEEGGLFQGRKDEAAQGVAEEKEEAEESVCFAVYLYDPVHALRFGTVSQGVPELWIGWMDAGKPGRSSSSSSGTTLHRTETEMEQTARLEGGGDGTEGLPEEIAEIVRSGGVDPREWVAEWLEEVLSLAVGVLAQRYVARRMGVGEGGLKRGKGREEVLEGGAGEAARAM